jgi:DNA-binding response OmpR family regulator
MRKILIVEDDTKIRFLLKRMLEKKFHMEVFEANNGAHGLDVYRQYNPKLIFLDVNMPVMDGKEFLRQLRNENINVPVVVMTCNNDKEIVAQMVMMGISDYIIKSDFIIFLESRITEILEKHIKTAKVVA